MSYELPRRPTEYIERPSETNQPTEVRPYDGRTYEALLVVRPLGSNPESRPPSPLSALLEKIQAGTGSFVVELGEVKFVPNEQRLAAGNETPAANGTAETPAAQNPELLRTNAPEAAAEANIETTSTPDEATESTGTPIEQMSPDELVKQLRGSLLAFKQGFEEALAKQAEELGQPVGTVMNTPEGPVDIMEVVNGLLAKSAPAEEQTEQTGDQQPIEATAATETPAEQPDNYEQPAESRGYSEESAIEPTGTVEITEEELTNGEKYVLGIVLEAEQAAAAAKQDEAGKQATELNAQQPDAAAEQALPAAEQRPVEPVETAEPAELAVETAVETPETEATEAMPVAEAAPVEAAPETQPQQAETVQTDVEQAPAESVEPEIIPEQAPVEQHVTEDAATGETPAEAAPVEQETPVAEAAPAEQHTTERATEPDEASATSQPETFDTIEPPREVQQIRMSIIETVPIAANETQPADEPAAEAEADAEASSNLNAYEEELERRREEYDEREMPERTIPLTPPVERPPFVPTPAGITVTDESTTQLDRIKGLSQMTFQQPEAIAPTAPNQFEGGETAPQPEVAAEPSIQLFENAIRSYTEQGTGDSTTQQQPQTPTPAIVTQQFETDAATTVTIVADPGIQAGGEAPAAQVTLTESRPATPNDIVRIEGTVEATVDPGSLVATTSAEFTRVDNPDGTSWMSRTDSKTITTIDGVVVSPTTTESRVATISEVAAVAAALATSPTEAATTAPAGETGTVGEGGGEGGSDGDATGEAATEGTGDSATAAGTTSAGGGTGTSGGA
jgi:hypothetical protein